MIDSLSKTPKPSVASMLRSMMETWAFAAFLPLPALVAIDPAHSADIACIYLGVINAWLVAEYHRVWGTPGSVACWWARARALAVTIGVNVAVFVGFGVAADVQTNFPFPLMAALSAIPAFGVMPWMLRTLPQRPYAAIVFGGFIIFACKLAGCVVARLVYGPDYISHGYVAADWRTAKLMITLLWLFSILLSLALLMVDYRCCARKEHHRVGSI